jgi:hypothetical protein
MNHAIATLFLLSGAMSPVLAAAPPAAGIAEGEPAAISVRVDPAPVSPGGSAAVQLVLRPAPGIKINKYPRIKLNIPAASGLLAAAEGSVGADSPPPPDRLEDNYFKTIDPVEATVRIDEAAHAGRHEVEAKLTYFYCVAASGYCAPARVAVKIPIEIR